MGKLIDRLTDELVERLCDATALEQACILDEHFGDDPVGRHRIAQLIYCLNALCNALAIKIGEAGAAEDARQDDSGFDPDVRFDHRTLGAMCYVYRLRNPGTHDTVVLKHLPLILAADPVRRARVLDDARIARWIDHPNLGAVSAVDSDDDHGHVIQLDWVEGRTLVDLLEEGRTSADEAVSVILRVAAGLAALHAYDAVHGDVRPSNIVTTGTDELKLVDYGVARLWVPWLQRRPSGDNSTSIGSARRDEERLKRDADVIAYASPEALKGDDLDERADVWGLGAVLYELLSGCRPFAGETPNELVECILHTDPPPLQRVAPLVPRRLADIVHVCLARDPNHRFQRIADLDAELRASRA
jgi:eukaryotic-like serine/threonine-protein kinase